MSVDINIHKNDGQANYGIFRCRGKIAPQTAHHHQQAAPYIILIDNFNDARAFSSSLAASTSPS